MCVKQISSHVTNYILTFQLTGLLSDIILTVVIAFVLFMCFENPIYKLTKQLIGLYINSRIREKKL